MKPLYLEIRAFGPYADVQAIDFAQLRDYRFYASDMLHPSDVAVDYIWQRFGDTYFSSETLNLIKELERLRADLNHRPLHPETEEYRLFQLSVEKKKNGLIQDYPFLKERLQ